MMIKILGSLLASLFLFGCIGVSRTAEVYEPVPKMKGVSFAAWWHDAFLTSESDLSLRNIKDTGAEWVSIVPTWYQDDKTSTNIYRDIWRSLSDESVIHAIDEAHRLGLKVMLKPHVDSQSGEWRGEFMPEDADAWFRSYTDFILHFAGMAKSHDVEMLCVGTEFVKINRFLPSAGNHWRGVVSEIKKVYSGPLTYAANWGDWGWGEFYFVGFWDLMDYAGIDAYFNLTDKENPTVEELVSAWRKWEGNLESWQRDAGKPILFTEIGYRSISGANREPWDWSKKGKVNLEEQANCYEAAFEVFWGKPWFAGFFWWDWGTKAHIDINLDTDYTPFGKPAEEVLRKWYGK
ncbi:MAG: glycoside hydrolase family 113 [bacterium]